MTTAAEWFHRNFGQPSPLPLDEGLAQTPDATHWSTLDDPRLAPDVLMTPRFPEGLTGYAVIGHWGYGIGSQAFYYVRCEPAHRCFFRVAYGGAYDDDPRQAQQIVAALEAYRQLRDNEALAASEIVFSMRTGHARLQVADRQPLELDIWQAAAGVGAPAPRVGEFLRFLQRRVEVL